MNDSGQGIDHSKCVKASQYDKNAHTHEGETGFWLFPDEARDKEKGS